MQEQEKYLTIKVNEYIYPMTVSKSKSVVSWTTNMCEDVNKASVDYLPEINVAMPEVTNLGLPPYLPTEMQLLSST
ncbi:MAG: hypothetical protein M1148_03240 [Candidatus Thermoplasmatota archaeon]|jgi:hypothetical protein|nr:hypothetical protein [Candidatus Thermoplasmatota archaeon]